MLFYKIPNPDEAMLISGGKGGKGATPFKVVMGHGAYVLPVFRRTSFLSLAMREAEVQEVCYSKHSIEVELRAVMAFHVGIAEEQVVKAGRNFIQDQRNMVERAAKIFAGHLRSIAGSMSVEEMIQERQKLAEEVVDASLTEMDKLGLVVDSFQIENLDDRGANYIAALAAPHHAEVQRNARVAKANNDRDAAQAERLAETKQADYERERDMARAGYTAQTAQAQAAADAASQTAQAQAEASIAEANADRDRRQKVANAKASEESGAAQATADQAGPLAQAKAQHEVAVAATTLASQRAKQVEEELKASVVAPAKADAERRVAEATADATATELKAKALASSNRVQVDMKLVEQLPVVAQAVASELRGANLTVLNGAEGLTELVVGAVAQAKSIYETMKTVNAAPVHTENGTGEIEITVPVESQS